MLSTLILLAFQNVGLSGSRPMRKCVQKFSIIEEGSNAARDMMTKARLTGAALI